MELVAAQRPFVYFPLARHWEQQDFVTHRLDHYRAGTRLDFATTSPRDLATAMLAGDEPPAALPGGATQRRERGRRADRVAARPLIWSNGGMRLRLGRPSLTPYADRFDVPAAGPDGLSVTFLGVSTPAARRRRRRR